MHTVVHVEPGRQHALGGSNRPTDGDDRWGWLDGAVDDPVATLVRHVRVEHDRFVDAAVRRIVRVVYGRETGEDVPRRELWWTVRDNLDTVLLALLEQRPLSEAELQARKDLGCRRARQGVPLDDVMRAFRVGYAELWEGLSRLAAALGEDCARALLHQAAHVWEVFDQVTSAVAEAYRATSNSQYLDRRRRSVALLAGIQHHPEDRDATEQLARSMGLDPHGTIACAIVTSSTRHLGAERDLVVIEQPDRYVVIAAVTGEPSAAEATLAGRLRRQGLTGIGVGILRHGLAGAQQSLMDAEWAHALSIATDTPAVLYRESWLACLALRHHEQLELLVAPAVQMLLDDEELIATLEAFLEADGNLTSAGKSLYVHANTIGYRLRQFTSRTGIDPRTPEGMALVQVTLTHARLARQGASVDRSS